MQNDDFRCIVTQYKEGRRGVITHKKRKPHGLRFSFIFLFQSLELHTFLENMRPVRKRRIRFLTDAKIGVFFFPGVVGFVVFAVVLRVVGP